MQLKLTGPAANRQDLILTYLTEFGEKCSDKVIRLRELRPGVGEKLHLKLTKGEELVPITLSPHAELQLLQRLRIPASYFHRCPPGLQYAQIMHWLLIAYRDKEVLLRFAGEELIRAVLTQRYIAQDDLTCIPDILTGLSQRQDLHIRSFYKDNDFTLLRTLFTDLMVISPNDSNRHYWAGIEVCNSETGMSALRISPVIRTGSAATSRAYDLIDKKSEGVTRLLHINQKEKETIQNAINLALKTAQAAISHLLLLETQPVQNPAQVIRDWTETTDYLPNRLISIVIEEFEAQQEASKLAIAERVLEAIKDLPVFSKRLAEAEVGRFLDLFKDTDERIEGILAVATF